jgi:hypothetical protein
MQKNLSYLNSAAAGMSDDSDEYDDNLSLVLSPLGTTVFSGDTPPGRRQVVVCFRHCRYAHALRDPPPPPRCVYMCPSRIGRLIPNAVREAAREAALHHPTSTSTRRSPRSRHYTLLSSKMLGKGKRQHHTHQLDDHLSKPLHSHHS